MRRFVRVAAFLIIVILPSPLRASDAPEASSPQFTGEIVIGATFPRTGFLEDYGLSAYYGANTCVRKINAEGGVNGKKLVLVWRDNRSDPAVAEENVRELVEKHRVSAILGPLMSDAALRVRPLVRQLGVVVMSPMSTMDAVGDREPWLFRATFNNSAEADALIAFQRDKYGAASCGILFDPRYAFSREMADIYEKKIAESGGICTGKYPVVDAGGIKEYAEPLRALAEKSPDYIFAPVYALEATEIIRAAKELNIGTRFCGHYTWDNELVFDGSGSRLAGTSFASSLFESAFSRPFRVFFEAMQEAGMENPDASAACAYDAMTLLAHALGQGETPEEIRQALLSVNNMTLATGRVSITPEGNALKPVLVRVVERKGYQLVPVYAERYDPPRPRRRH